MIEKQRCDNSLYNENESYTQPAWELQEQMDALMRQVFYQWMERGFKIRDINNVIRGSIDKVQMEMFAYKVKK